LKRVGGRNYWAHPSTRALCVVLHDTRTGATDLWLPGDPCPITPADVLGAHNARGFDRFGAARLWGFDPCDPSWIDTSELARRAGLPGALDALATRWLGRSKDKEGSRFTVGLSTVRRPSGKHNPDAITPEEWRTYSAAEKRERGALPPVGAAELARVAPYCISDVDVLEHGWPDLEPWLDVCEFESAVSAVERVVDDRGIQFDAQLAARLLEEDERAASEVLDLVAEVVGESVERVREIAQSPEQFCEHAGTENAQKATVDMIISAYSERFDAQPDAYFYASARRALASIARGKLEAGLLRVSPDGALRDSHRYYGGHTGRWSGRGMQLQNMPRPAKRFEEWGDAEVCREADRILAGGHADPELIDMMLRATLVSRNGALAVCDFAGVEARANAWAAGDGAALEVFADATRSPYKEMAAQIFGCSADMGKGDPKYTVGKVAELACGYGMGGPKFLWTAQAAGADLIAMGIDPAEVVAAWRAKHAPIVKFWRELERAFLRAVRGEASRVSCFAFEPATDGSAVAIFLPSGRPIVYNDAREGVSEWGKPSLSYHGARGREHLYGGKICENVIQAFCRDLMAEALVNAERAGLAPVLHVHDEIVADVPNGEEGLAELRRIMLTLPAWAEGFPIGASGHFGARYRK
jgi:DNA polymerase